MTHMSSEEPIHPCFKFSYSYVSPSAATTGSVKSSKDIGQQRSGGGPSAWLSPRILRVSLTQVQKRTATRSPQHQKAMSPGMVPREWKHCEALINSNKH